VGTNVDGWDKKISRVLYNDTTPFALIEYFKHCLLAFVVHNFIAHWQDKKFKQYMKHILEDTLVTCIGFHSRSLSWFKSHINIIQIMM
jgi:hypothetical protein